MSGIPFARISAHQFLRTSPKPAHSRRPATRKVAKFMTALRESRPRLQGVCRDRRLISLLQRIRPRRSPPGQDGDTRTPVLINSSASCAVFNTRLPERRLTVRPSRRHPLANPACTTGAFAPSERISTRPRIPRWRQTVSYAAAPPRRSSPACSPRRRPRHCDGPSSSALSPIGPSGVSRSAI